MPNNPLPVPQVTWFVARNGVRRGPFSELELMNLTRSGDVASSHLVLTKAMAPRSRGAGDDIWTLCALLLPAISVGELRFPMAKFRGSRSHDLPLISCAEPKPAPSLMLTAEMSSVKDLIWWGFESVEPRTEARLGPMARPQRYGFRLPPCN